VIILDACRDNPFGSLKGIDQKGLSQMDAPQSTLLAYATSPGNVASDGAGEHGLYTEYLLHEVKVPEAKVEDIFKRVRLGVRRKTNGAQIPWESTSLEEDFYFLPPANLKKLSEEEKERQFNEEFAVWERVKEANAPGPLEEYLQRYPTGEFSELAQLRLDIVLSQQGEKRIEVASQTGNPFSQGFMRADTKFKVGDFHAYRVLDPLTRQQRGRFKGVVTAVTDTEVIIDNGAVVLDLMGNTKKNRQGLQFTDNQNMPVEFYVGKKWSTQYRYFNPKSPKIRLMGEIEYKIVGRETITVPAGTFDCFKIQGVGEVGPVTSVKSEVHSITWYAPDKVRHAVAQDIIRRHPPQFSNRLPSSRLELVAFNQN
jgi:hypothetical protein